MYIAKCTWAKPFDGKKPHEEDKHGLLGTTHHLLIIQNTNIRLTAWKDPWQELQWWNKPQWCATAVTLKEELHKSQSYPTLSQRKVGDRLETEEKRVLQQQAGYSGGKRSQERVKRHCQMPRAIQASAGHVKRAPRPAVLVGCELQNWGYLGDLLSHCFLKIPLHPNENTQWGGNCHVKSSCPKCH